jgi:hypothetical protein
MIQIDPMADIKTVILDSTKSISANTYLRFQIGATAAPMSDVQQTLSLRKIFSRSNFNQVPRQPNFNLKTK